MIVYRYINEKELKAIQNNDIQSLGRNFSDKMTNDFQYEKDIKYLHFYKEFKSMQYIREYKFEDKSSGDFYFCSFDIPDTLLIAGKGTYHNLNFVSGLISVDEFILDVNQFNSKWLINAQKDIKRKGDSKKYYDNMLCFVKEQIKTAKTLYCEEDFVKEFNNAREL